MGDHEYDYAVEAAEEAYYEHVLSELRRDHGEEIADEITTQEVIEAVVGSHEKWWPLASAATEKAKTRLAQSEYEEVVFHATRAFDGYLRNVFVLPLKAALAERFQRFMPPKFPFRENAFFRAANGVGDNAAWLVIYCRWSR